MVFRPMYKVQSLKNGFLPNVQSTKPEKLIFCPMYKVQSLKNGFLLNVQSTKPEKWFFAQWTCYICWYNGYARNSYI